MGCCSRHLKIVFQQMLYGLWGIGGFPCPKSVLLYQLWVGKAQESLEFRHCLALTTSIMERQLLSHIIVVVCDKCKET